MVECCRRSSTCVCVYGLPAIYIFELYVCVFFSHTNFKTTSYYRIFAMKVTVQTVQNGNSNSISNL